MVRHRFSGAIGATTGGRPAPGACCVPVVAYDLLRIAFQGACPRHDCSFNHDDSLMPEGYLKAHASKKRSMNQSEGGPEESLPKRRL